MEAVNVKEKTVASTEKKLDSTLAGPQKTLSKIIKIEETKYTAIKT